MENETENNPNVTRKLPGRVRMPTKTCKSIITKH